MNNIKALYTDYSDIFQKFGKETIEKKILYFLNLMTDFIQSVDAKDKIRINDSILSYCILDYYSDVYRLMSFHKIEKINSIKRISYESKWILRRKPIQVLTDNPEDENLIFANEKFVLSYLTHELLLSQNNVNYSEEALRHYSSFVDSLYYHLKYRDFDAKVLELMIIAFKSGISLGKELRD